MFSPQVTALVMNALHKEIHTLAEQRAGQLQSSSLENFVKVPVPPDGLCAYHSIVGSLSYESWSKVSRYANGFAVNPRVEQTESKTVKRLREHALVHTPENDPVIAEQALEAQKSLTVDIGELSWLGASLDLAIRCSISTEARLIKQHGHYTVVEFVCIV